MRTIECIIEDLDYSIQNLNEGKTNNEESMMNQLVDELKNHFEWNDFEYVYTDDEFIDELKNVGNYNDKIMITNDFENNYHMFDINEFENITTESTKIEFTPTVDLLITEKTDEKLHNLLDEHTIITKVFPNGVIYIEDAFEKLKIIITHNEHIVLKGDGIDTELL